MSPDLDINALLAFPRRLIPDSSGTLSKTPSLQWRDRAGLSPASILAPAENTPENTNLLLSSLITIPPGRYFGKTLLKKIALC